MALITKTNNYYEHGVPTSSIVDPVIDTTGDFTLAMSVYLGSTDCMPSLGSNVSSFQTSLRANRRNSAITFNGYGYGIGGFNQSIIQVPNADPLYPDVSNKWVCVIFTREGTNLDLYVYDTETGNLIAQDSDTATNTITQGTYGCRFSIEDGGPNKELGVGEFAGWTKALTAQERVTMATTGFPYKTLPTDIAFNVSFMLPFDWQADGVSTLTDLVSGQTYSTSTTTQFINGVNSFYSADFYGDPVAPILVEVDETFYDGAELTIFSALAGAGRIVVRQESTPSNDSAEQIWNGSGIKTDITLPITSFTVDGLQTNTDYVVYLVVDLGGGTYVSSFATLKTACRLDLALSDVEGEFRSLSGVKWAWFPQWDVEDTSQSAEASGTFDLPSDGNYILSIPSTNSTNAGTQGSLVLDNDPNTAHYKVTVS